MTTPLLLIAVAALLLLALVVALAVQHRRERAAVPAGPRTVAELVSQRGERAPAAEPVDAAPDVPDEPVPTPVERVVGRRAIERRAAERRPVVAVDTPVDTGAVDTGAVAPLGDDVPWRRATQITTGPSAESRPVPSERRSPPLALLRRPARRDPVSRPAARRDVATRTEPPAVTVTADAVRTPTAPEAPPALVVPTAAVVPEPTAEPAAPTAVVTAPQAADAEASPAEMPVAELSAVEAAGAEPPTRPRRDPVHLAAEHAAADLALLRTFGTTDLGSRPDRAPVVALERAPVPETPPAGGAAQPVRFRTVRRDGAAVADAAVALLDDRGREACTGRSDAAGEGELRAPHPGSYVLVATAPDHQPGAVALTVTDAPPAVDVLLVRSAALLGTVTGEDGPIDGARVTVVQDGEIVEATNTDADGRFRVADLAAGEYAVSVAAAGCEPDVDLVAVADEAEQHHDVDLAPAAVPAG